MEHFTRAQAKTAERTRRVIVKMGDSLISSKKTMQEANDIEWFKNKLAPEFTGYELEYKFFSEGDFGSLNQVEFNSKKIGVVIDFWGLGWLGIFVYDFEKEEQLLNVLIEPGQEEEKSTAFKKLQSLL